MSIKGRIENLEKKYGRGEGCIQLRVTCDGLVEPPEGQPICILRKTSFATNAQGTVYVFCIGMVKPSARTVIWRVKPRKKKVNREGITPF